MNASLSPQQVRVLRMQSQRLVPAGGDGPDTPAGEAPAVTPNSVAQAVGGLQAQDLPAARLSIHARAAGITLEAVERARQEERTLAWTWLMRGTLHLVPAEDARWLLGVFGERNVAGGARRRRELGLTEEVLAAALDV
ncbi:MAG TPA: crosslink repair DNA glycosylase YcaQ family protein, partial [Longimicrobiales bacterium]